MVQEQVEEKVEEQLIEVAAREAGTLKELREVTDELDQETIPKGEGGEGRYNLLSTADSIPMWNRATGRMSHILTDQVGFQMRKRFPPHHPMAGQRVYSRTPVAVPEAQKIKCWLHPKHEMRPWLDSIGLQGRTCHLETIPTDYAVRVHMRRKHPTAYDIILDEQSKKREREDREMRQKELDALTRLADGRGSQADGETPDPLAPPVHHCRTEGCPRYFDTEKARNFHENTGHKEVKRGVRSKS